MTIFNQDFENTPNFRTGSMDDVKYLEATFERFGMKPDFQRNLKYKDIVKEVEACK